MKKPNMCEHAVQSFLYLYRVIDNLESKNCKNAFKKGSIGCFADGCDASIDELRFCFQCMDIYCFKHATQHYSEEHKVNAGPEIPREDRGEENSLNDDRLSVFVTIKGGKLWCHHEDHVVRERGPMEIIHDSKSKVTSFEMMQMQEDLKDLLADYRVAKEEELLLKSYSHSKPLRATSVNEITGLCGLNNLGNTCYLNSVIQALRHCEILKRYLLGIDKKHIFRKGGGKLMTQELQERIFLELSQLVIDMESQKYSMLEPADFIKLVKKLYPDLKGDTQQDAQEALHFILVAMHEALEVQFYPSKAQPKNLIEGMVIDKVKEEEEEEEGDDLEETKTENENEFKKTQSIVSDCFQGSTTSSLTCNVCSNVSLSEESFFDISLSIPKLAPVPKKAKDSFFSSFFSVQKTKETDNFDTNKVPLSSLLEDYTKSEEIDEVFCSKCKKFNRTSKHVSIKNAPQNMCFHLKRFSATSAFGTKISTMVTFPLENLNLSKFMETPPENEEDSLYHLVAVVVHLGALHGGHYITHALNKQSQKWFTFDDEKVIPVHFGKVAMSEAYMLFYEKTPSLAKKQLVEEVKAALHSTVPSTPSFVSGYWMLKLLYSSNPSAICNADVGVCRHGAIQPDFDLVEVKNILQPDEAKGDDRKLHFGGIVKVPSFLLNNLQKDFGVVKHILKNEYCSICKKDREWLESRRKEERAFFERLENKDVIHTGDWYIMDERWLAEWRRFTFDENELSLPPGPITNNRLVSTDGRVFQNKILHKHYRGVNEQVWRYLHDKYKGGPEIKRASPLANILV